VKDIKTIEIKLETGDLILFQYPQAEEGMVLSVLNGEEYPLSYISNIQKNPVIIDLGSNFGSSIVYFKDKYPNSMIYGFEPSSETYKKLKINVKNLKKVSVEKLAVWDKKGKFRLNYGPGKRTGSFTLREWHEDLGGEFVQTTTFSEIVESRGINEVDILKMDIEAVEFDVLCNIFIESSNILIKNIFVEYHGKDVFSEIKKIYSEIYNIIPCGEHNNDQGVILMALK